jgi:DNA processing protein
MEAIMEHGAVVSEFPLGTAPDAPLFPRRNKIISGLSLGVVVVEAPEKSGALLTAQYARVQGRKVFAVPGSIHSGVSKGTNQLIKDGAALVVDAHDVLAAIPSAPNRRKSSAAVAMQAARPQATPALNEEEACIFRHLSREPVHIDELVQKSKLPSAKILSVLLPLELKGLVVQGTGKMFARSV